MIEGLVRALGDHHGVIGAANAERMAQETGTDVSQLMTLLLPVAAGYARPPISDFHVGVVARGLSGALYFGANVEFAGEALSFTVHAEQSAVANAWMAGEQGIESIAVTAAPCGYCRQFLNELTTADRLEVQMPAGRMALRELLPNAFGPRDLGIEGGLMHVDVLPLMLDEADELLHAAAGAAIRSYAPYSHSPAGVALRTADGTVVTGAYAENAAFNPSMSPLEVALSQLNLRGRSFDTITDAALVSVDALHDNATRTVLAAITQVPLRIARAHYSA